MRRRPVPRAVRKPVRPAGNREGSHTDDSHTDDSDVAPPFAHGIVGYRSAMRIGNVEIKPLGGGAGCLIMILLSVLLSVLLTIVLNLLL